MLVVIILIFNQEPYFGRFLFWSFEKCFLMVYSLNSLNLKRCWITESNFSWEKNTCLMYSTLEKEMATHSSVLAWRTPGMGEPGGLPSMGSHRVGHDWSDLAAAAAAALYSACMHICVLSHVWFFVTPWTVAHQDPLSMKSSRQEYWSRLPFSFSRESSLPRNQTCVSCFSGIGRWILYHCATWEVPSINSINGQFC